MKTLVWPAVLFTLCTLALLPTRAQNYPPPPPDQGAYGVPPDQGQIPPPPDQGQMEPQQDQQNYSDQGQPGQGDAPDQSAADPNAPDQPASFQTFYDNLASQGTWIQSSDYGYVWQPTVNDPNWAPYTEGHWVYSDAGWTWVSDEPWGWATYHYGRWVNLDGTGWCWVPGYTWAPAWVSWRYGDGYCGWAPLPPDSFVGIDYGSPGVEISVGFHIGGDCDSYYGIGAGCYHFVPVAYLGYRNYRGYYANPHNNYAIINRTTNVTNLNVAAHGGYQGARRFNHVTMGGPSIDQVNAASQNAIPRVHLANAAHPGPAQLANNSLMVYAPRVGPGAAGQPSHVWGSLGRTTVNRGVDVNRPLQVNQHFTAQAPTPNEIQAARIAQQNAPQHSHIVTSSTQVSPPLQAPLSSLKPIAPTYVAPRNTFNAGRPAQTPGVNPGATTYHNPQGGVANHAPNSGNNPFMQPVHSNTNQNFNGSNNGGNSSAPHAGNQQPNTYYHPQAAPQNNGYVQQPHQNSTPQQQSQPQPAPVVVHHNESPTVNHVFPPQAQSQPRPAPPPSNTFQSHPQPQPQSAPAPNNTAQSQPQPQSAPAPNNNQRTATPSGPSVAPTRGNWGNPNQQQNH